MRQIFLGQKEVKQRKVGSRNIWEKSQTRGTLTANPLVYKDSTSIVVTEKPDRLFFDLTFAPARSVEEMKMVWAVSASLSGARYIPDTIWLTKNTAGKVQRMRLVFYLHFSKARDVWHNLTNSGRTGVFMVCLWKKVPHPMAHYSRIGSFAFYPSLTPFLLPDKNNILCERSLYFQKTDTKTKWAHIMDAYMVSCGVYGEQVTAFRSDYGGLGIGGVDIYCLAFLSDEGMRKLIGRHWTWQDTSPVYLPLVLWKLNQTGVDAEIERARRG